MHTTASETESLSFFAEQGESAPAAPAARSRRLENASLALALGAAAGLIIPGPAWMSVALFKFSLFLIGFSVAAVLYFLEYRAGRARVHIPLRELLFLVPLPLAYLLSWAFSADRAVGLLGTGTETDTVLFVIIGVLAFSLSYLLAGARSAASFVRTLVWSGVAAAAVQVAVILGLPLLPGSGSDRTMNLVGAWNDLAVFMGLLGILLIFRLAFRRGRQAWGYGALFAMGAFILLNVNLPFVSWAGALSCAMLLYLSYWHEIDGAHRKLFSAFLAFCCATAVILALWGTPILTRLPERISVLAVSVRPSFAATYSVVQEAHATFGSFLLGSGPDTFAVEWLLHKPLAINLTPFWATQFSSGVSVLGTAFVTVGLIGALAWLLPFFGLCLSLPRARAFAFRVPLQERETFVSLGFASVYLWAATFFYVPNQMLVVLAFVSAGLYAGLLFPREGAHFASAHRKSTYALVVLGLLLALISTLLYLRHFISGIYLERSAIALTAGDYAQASALNARSLALEENPQNTILAERIDFGEIQNMINTATTTAQAEALKPAFDAALQDSVLKQRRAAALDPASYLPFLDIANVYDLLGQLKVQGAYENEESAYREAIKRNPTNPALPLLLARAEVSQNLAQNLPDIQKLIAQSLALKSDFTDAFLLAEQVAVAQNNLPVATEAVRAAAESSPNEAPLWFQLGLFYYAEGDIHNSVAALGRAVELVPTYANAKYFLGLAEYRQGNTADALKQFQDIAATNPNNQEVQAILANLKAGKNPFAGLQNSLKNPAARSSAPIRQ